MNGIRVQMGPKEGQRENGAGICSIFLNDMTKKQHVVRTKLQLKYTQTT